MTRKDYVLIADTIKGSMNYEQTFTNNPTRAEAIKFLAITSPQPLRPITLDSIEIAS